MGIPWKNDDEAIKHLDLVLIDQKELRHGSQYCTFDAIDLFFISNTKHNLIARSCYLKSC